MKETNDEAENVLPIDQNADIDWLGMEYGYASYTGGTNRKAVATAAETIAVNIDVLLSHDSKSDEQVLFSAIASIMGTQAFSLQRAHAKSTVSPSLLERNLRFHLQSNFDNNWVYLGKRFVELKETAGQTLDLPDTPLLVINCQIFLFESHDIELELKVSYAQTRSFCSDKLLQKTAKSFSKVEFLPAFLLPNFEQVYVPKRSTSVLSQVTKDMAVMWAQKHGVSIGITEQDEATPIQRTPNSAATPDEIEVMYILCP